LLIEIGAVLLLFRGLISDAIGFILLFPVTRLLLRSAVIRWIERYIFIDI